MAGFSGDFDEKNHPVDNKVMTMRQNLLIGSVSIFLWFFVYQPALINTALAFSFFVLVPALLSAANVPSYKNLFHFSWLFAWFGVLSLSLENEIFTVFGAGLWFVFTGFVSWTGLRRLLARGISPVEETAVDIGYMYLVIGGAWFVAAQTGAEAILPYSGTIVELTAVHFHYAAFLLPVVTGLLGRWLYHQEPDQQSRAYRFFAAGIIIGPILTAAAVDQGPPLEAGLVFVYVIFLYWFAFWSIKAGLAMPVFSKIAIMPASIILLWTMTCSVLYSFGRALGVSMIDLSGMLLWHGAWNALVFSTLAAACWYALAPAPRSFYNQFPVTSLRGKRHIAGKLEKNRSLEEVGMLLSTWQPYKRDDFDPALLTPLVAAFYTNTEEFQMEADIHWNLPFLFPVSSFFTKRMKQINIPSSGNTVMSGKVYRIAEDKRGASRPHIWMRHVHSTGEPLFTAAYSHYTKEDITYFNIGLPLPAGVMTGILRPEHDGEGALQLTSSKRSDKRGDEGIYLTVGGVTVKTPLREAFHVQQTGPNALKATHHLKIGSCPFITITYRLTLF